MKRVLLASLFAAVLFGPLIAFVDSVAWTRVRYRYEPGISQAEMRQWDQLSVAQLEAQIEKRRVPYTKAQWLADSVSSRFFWTDLAKRSLVPDLCVFLACACVGGLVRRQTRVETPSNRTEPNG